MASNNSSVESQEQQESYDQRFEYQSKKLRYWVSKQALLDKMAVDGWRFVESVDDSGDTEFIFERPVSQGVDNGA